MTIASPPAIIALYTLLIFSYTRAKTPCPKPDALPSPFPSPFPSFPMLFPMAILRIKKTCSLMPLIPLHEVSSRFFHLKACLNPLFFAQFIAPHSILCQDHDQSSIPHVLSSSRTFPMLFFAFRSLLFPFRYEDEWCAILGSQSYHSFSRRASAHENAMSKSDFIPMRRSIYISYRTWFSREFFTM